MFVHQGGLRNGGLWRFWGLALGLALIVGVGPGGGELGWTGAAAAGAAENEGAPAWLGSRAGVSDRVLPPWTPVEASAQDVRVWGRTCRFGELALPASIVTRKTEILAAPVRLVGQVGGKELVWRGSGCRLVEAKPDAARLAARADSESLRCQGSVRVEYDGMIRADLELAPRRGKAAIDRLVLEIPLQSRFARYLHYWPGRWGSVFNSAALPEDGYCGPFRPFVWLGDEWRGLAWFCESDRHFYTQHEDQVIQIERRGDTTVLRVRLITARQTIDSPLEYTFGFQATPVGPARPDVWDYRICHMGSYHLSDAALDRLAQAGVRTICFHEQWTDIQAYPKTTHGEQLRKLVRACHRRHIQLLLYFGYEMSTIAPEWPEYHERCLVFPRRGGYKRKYQPEPDQTAYVVCYRSVWQDFIAHQLQQALDNYGFDGVYLDGTSEPWGCRNTKHGCGYARPNGQKRLTYPIFDTRRMMRRIYTIVKTHDPAGQINVHQSTCMTIPTLAFATSYWDGEQLQSVARRALAQELLPLDAFRCEFMGHNWGVPAELLHYASGPFKRFEAVSMALLHDVLVRPSTMADVQASAKMWKAMDRFGRSEAQWLPYWDSGKYVRTDPPDVKVSIYNRPGKGMIAVIANMGRTKATGQVQFDLKALGQTGRLIARDVLAERPVPFADGQLTVPLESLDFVMLSFEAD